MIVVLNGASSAGKTTLARALQEAWAEPALVWGIDTVVSALPRRYLNALWSTEMYRYGYGPDGTVTTISPGPYGDRVVRALRLRQLVRTRTSCRNRGDDLRAACAGLASLIVHVSCPPDILARRERDRGDRTLGQALAQHTAVARSIDHDLVIDTSALDPSAAAKRVLAAITQVRTVSPSHR